MLLNAKHSIVTASCLIKKLLFIVEEKWSLKNNEATTPSSEMKFLQILFKLQLII